MRQNEANYVKMVNNVLTGLETEAAKWKGIKPMQRVVADLQATYAKISEAAQVQTGSNPTGYTAEKNRRYLEMGELAFRLGKKLSAYAKLNGQTALLPLVDYTQFSLTKGPENEVVLRCQTIATEAEKRLKALADFQVTAEEIAAVRTAVDTYRKLPGTRDRILGERVLAGQHITTHVQTLRQLMDTLDDLINGMVIDAALKQQYGQWRNIPNTGSGKRKSGTKEKDTEGV